MEKVLCSVHGLPCVLKTGIRDGPNKGKSFYMCGVRDQPSCGFQLSTDLCPSYCLMHEEHAVDLQALIPQQEKGTYRLLFRCDKTKLEGKKWCGSVPWQDSKTTRLPTKPQSQHTLELLHNHRDQRNPFKIPGKNHELSLKQGNDGEDKKSVKNEKENREFLNSDKRELQKFSSESFRKALLSGITIESQQFAEGKSESRERIEAQTKSCKSAIETEKPHSKLHQYGSSKMFETSSGHIRKDSTVRSTEDISQKGVRPKQSLPNVNRQTSTTKPLNGEQPGKGDSKTYRDKTVAVKTNGKMDSDGRIEEKALISTEPLSAQKCTGLPAVPPKGNPEEQPAFQTGTVPQEKICPRKDVGSDVFVPRKWPVEFAPEGKVHHQKNVSSDSQERVLQKKAVVNPKDLHNHLTAQLKQKKNTLKMVKLESLPDKGERLVKQVQELEAALSSLNLETEEHVKEGDVSSTRSEELPQNPFSKTTMKPPGTVREGGPQSFQDRHAASSLDLHAPLGSSQHLSGTYGENSHVQALYGGRMTEDRLRDVYNATTDAINQIHKSLESCPTEETVAEDPAGLKVSLLLHQKQALAWLLWRENQKPCGGILADDMGLGKTLTMIALILAQKLLQKEKGEKKLEIWLSRKDPSDVVSHGTLIVCPASLIHHWKKEVERHVRSGKLKVCLYHGPSRNKNTTALSDYDIVVTTYSILAKEIPTQKEEAEVPAEDLLVQDKSVPFSPLLWIKWARIILDEAHNIKNPKVQASIAACKLRATARWAVTGTPIQNNLLDVYSLLRFLRCSPFDEFKVWKSQVDNQTRKGGERLTILTRSLLLRRTKDQRDSSGKPLVMLPQRSTQLHRLKLSADERSVYDVLFARSRSTLQSYLKRQESRSGGHATDNPFDKAAQQFRHGQPNSFEKTDKDAPPVSTTVHILSLLLRLRQCCCHLSLLKVALDHANLNSEGISLSLEEQLSALTLAEPAKDDGQSMVYLLGTAFNVDLFEATTKSTKLSHLLEELKAIQTRSQKSVIVSQWTSMLKVVAVHLKRLGVKYATVDGSVNPKQRMDVVEEFNSNPNGPQVMLISLLAGGVGLNLVGGNHLFLFDMHWNPALEDQACDRIYRVGQRNNVTIHRFVCEETAEEKISELQAKKKELAQKVLSGRQDSFTKLNLADLKLLFGI